MTKAEKEALAALSNGRLRGSAQDDPKPASAAAAAANEDGVSQEETTVVTVSTSARGVESGSESEGGGLSDGDVSDDVRHSKRRRTKWSAECAATLPNFDLVRNNTRSVDELV